MEKFYKNQNLNNFYDFTIYLENKNENNLKSIKCHKGILMNRSFFFFSLFKQNSEKRKIFLKEYDFEVVNSIINYIYSSKIIFTSQNYPQMLKLAINFKLDLLKIRIEKEIEKEIQKI
ncbi:kelch-like protein 24 isoform x1 [Anaeramoeba ignava]|uniref:Kelch-like protein 24 isoform x1 n=1 Tax=Anaeramoeba ignava TaxID=1746090 RepID=A0A9Q0LGL6_ANAIG|nr:kelch-like protein 24 isoform x1 [Anaeramoeba ignava]